MAPRGTSDPFGWGLVMTETALGGTPSTRVWDTANRAYFWRLIGAATITKIGVRVGVSSGNISLAVYRNTGVGRAAAPGTQLATTGAIACPPAGVDTNVPLGSTVVLQPGDWVGMSCDNTTASFYGQSVGILVSSAYAGRGGYQSAAHPCPSSPVLTSAGYPGAVLLVGVP